MENRAEDEIRKRWEVEESERQQDDTSSTRPRKRLRQPDENTTSGSVASGIFGRIMSSMTQEGASMDEIPPQTSASSTTKVKMVNGRKIRGSNRGRNSAGRSRSRLTELSEEREETLDIIDVD